MNRESGSLGLEQVIAREKAKARKDRVCGKLWEIAQVANDLNIPVVYRNAEGHTRTILPGRNT